MQTVATEYAKKAYLEIKTIPIRATFFDNYDRAGNMTRCTCGLAAIYIFENLKEKNMEEIWEERSGNNVMEYFKEQGYSRYYLDGFITGFDGDIKNFPQDGDENSITYKEYCTGYDDGNNIWLEVNYLANTIPNIPRTE